MALATSSGLGRLLVITWTICLHLSGGVVEGQQPELCSLPKVVGPCKAAFPRYYFNSATQQCERFIFGGCQGNANNFVTLVQCQSACVCSLPMTMGIWQRGGRFCSWSMPRYYDSSTGICRPFLYWGCGGNGNRFTSNRKCINACASSQCYAPTQRGRCRSRSRSRSQRYFYNAENGQCERFTYSGCNDRNENRFSSQQACRRLCMSRNN